MKRPPAKNKWFLRISNSQGTVDCKYNIYFTNKIVFQLHNKFVYLCSWIMTKTLYM